MRRRLLAALLVLSVFTTGACGVHAIRGEITDPYPDLPAQAADYVATSSYVPLDLEGAETVSDGWLMGPHFNITISAVATRPALEATEASVLQFEASGFKAARAHEFVIVQIDTDAGRPPPWDPTNATVTATLVVDGTEQPYDLPGGWNQTIGSYTTPTSLLLVSVPRNRDALLKVTDEGVTQTIDLRTGTRGEDAVALFYADHSQTLGTPDYSAAGTAFIHPFGVATERPFTVAFDFADDVWVSLAPWTPAGGWAVPGAAWLTFGGFSVTCDGIDYSGAVPSISYTMDFPSTFTLTTADGTAIPAQPSTIEDVEFTFPTVDPYPYGAHFGVPETFDVGTLTVFPSGPMTGLYSDGDTPAPWVQPPAPLVIPIDLS